MIKLLNYEPLILIPLVYTILYILVYRSNRVLNRLVNIMSGSVNNFLRNTLLVCKLLIPLLIILILAKPVIVYNERIPINVETDVLKYNNKLPVEHIVLLDISKSMSYMEGASTRLDLAKDFIKKYLENLGSKDSVSIVLFSGNVTLYCRGYASDCINNVSSIEGFEKYTAIGDAVTYAVGRSKASGTPSVIVVVSDGANNYGSNPVNAIIDANESKAPVVFIRVGLDPRANGLVSRLRDHGFKVYSINDFSYNIINETIQKIVSYTKYTALKCSNQAYVNVQRYSYLLVNILLAIVFVIIVAISVEGV